MSIAFCAGTHTQRFFGTQSWQQLTARTRGRVSTFSRYPIYYKKQLRANVKTNVAFQMYVLSHPGTSLTPSTAVHRAAAYHPTSKSLVHAFVHSESTRTL